MSCSLDATEIVPVPADTDSRKSALSVNTWCTESMASCTRAFTFIETRPKNPIPIDVVATGETAAVPPAVLQFVAVARALQVTCNSFHSTAVVDGSLTQATVTSSTASIEFPETV